MSQPQKSVANPAAGNEKRHRKNLLSVSGVLLIATLVYVGVYLISSQYREVTEDAYVDGNVVQVTSQTTGTVTNINVDNTDMIASGQVVIALNPVDADLALKRSAAQLAKTVRQVRGQFSAASQMMANIELRRADLSRAQADMERRQSLVKTGAVSAEDFKHTEENVRVAQASLTVAQEQFAVNHALVDRVTIDQHPDVVAAAMQVRDAYVAKMRTQLRAPVTGMVTKRSAQVGQRISPGATLMSIVSLDHLWVSANFKESQLNHLRVGQKARVIADIYGHSVVYTGTVIGLDAGTGSAFSLMPAQNATGNWIKVVQRVPVRISLDTKEVAEHPLRIGLSMKVTVDTAERAGQTLPTAMKTAKQSYATSVFEDEEAGAEEIVSRIIQENIAARNKRGTS
ncbi:membrane fusion protein, multidrug efflux system [Collimonas sp. OK607]|uniref:HlyD family secretion protein n=1 Tax=Collimonas sp. OK607 TaxID=1798194 RepID=UPI0008E451B6|nr:HlyD family efflux transporter periplasmic adaptor subunit [Collimonas sp. OK607]SFB20878.1 membrane fusion protein, multidrug efflux system [Collimonas sp. OK607]